VSTLQVVDSFRDYFRGSGPAAAPPVKSLMALVAAASRMVQADVGTGHLGECALRDEVWGCRQ
jgi:hypothetical protein